MSRTPVSAPGQANRVEVCTATNYQDQADRNYVLIATTYRTQNKALSVMADELDQLLADLTQARKLLRSKGISTGPDTRQSGAKHCPICHARPGAHCVDRWSGLPMMVGGMIVNHPERAQGA